jgi:GTPase
MADMKLPVVAIVGRPNVGKSSLLNALAGKLISIVQDMPGVTRDRISTPLQINGKFIELVDTGGYGFEDEQGLTDHIKDQIHLAVSRASLVLFIVDAQAGLTGADQTIATLLREAGVKTVILANKADNEKVDLNLGEFGRLGLGTPLGISAKNTRQLDDLLGLIAENVDLSDAPETIPEPDMLVAIVGKRNAGKSTLVNAIAKIYEEDDNRVIVSEVAGTTRDSVDVRFEKDGKTLVVIDTAGVRKRRHMVNDDIEFYSFHRAERSIRRADVVLFLIDAGEPVSEPDKKLGQYIVEQHKPVVLVINKWDEAKKSLAEQRRGGPAPSDAEVMQQYRDYLDEEMSGLNFAPIAFITAKEGKNVPPLLDLARNLYKQANERVSTGRLNTALQAALDQRQPSSPRGRRAKIYYATQVATAPPTVVVFVNNPDNVDSSYQRYIVNRFRETLPFAEVPIVLHIRAKGEKSKAFSQMLIDTGKRPGAGRARPTGRGVKKSPKRNKGP